MNYLFFVCFWICQILSTIIFKYGGLHPKYHWTALVLGNIVLIVASWFLIQLFKTFPQPIVIALCSGGTFLTVQFAMALVFKQPLTWLQIAGSAVIVIGMLLVTFGGKEQLS